MTDEGRFQRWQRITIEQLGYVLNLVFGLTIAVLGYWLLLLRDGTFMPGPLGRKAMLLSFFALAASGVSGLVCTLNRLQDFRGTAQRARGKPGAPTEDQLNRLGKITWCLFYVQLIAFAVGVAGLATALLLTYSAKFL